MGMSTNTANPPVPEATEQSAIPSGYKRTEVGVIPSDWDVKKLGEIGDALIGLTYAPSDIRSYGTLVLRSSNIQNDALAFDDNVFVEMDIPEHIMVRSGDVLICARNGSRALIGKTALLDDRTEGMTFGAFMAVFRSTDGPFVNYLFQSSILKRQIDGHLGATINQITNKSLKSFLAPVPPSTDERNAIAEALSDVDGLIAALEKLIAKKRAIKQAAMQQLLTGKTRLPGFAGDWELGPFSASLIRLNAKQHQIFARDYKPFGGYPVIDQGQSPVIGFTDRGDKLFLCPAGGVIVFGDHTCIVKFVDYDFVIGADGTQILLSKGDEYTRFYAYLLQYDGVTPTGYNRHFRILRERLFRVPSPPEQQAIAQVLADMDAEIAALEHRRDKTQKIKQGMMQQLLTGRVRLVNGEAVS